MYYVINLEIVNIFGNGQGNVDAILMVHTPQEFNREPVIPIYSARPDQVEKALRHVYNVATNKLKGKELELLVAILPDNNGSLYGMHPSLLIHWLQPFFAYCLNMVQ